MNIKIRNSSNDPIYVQIKEQIKAAILSGELEQGSLLPSIRYLAKELRISVITTKRAYDELELEGFIHSVRGRGSFVAEQNSEFLREENRRKMEEHLLEAIRLAALAGLTVEEVQNTVAFLSESEEAL